MVVLGNGTTKIKSIHSGEKVDGFYETSNINMKKKEKVKKDLLCVCDEMH